MRGYLVFIFVFWIALNFRDCKLTQAHLRKAGPSFDGGAWSLFSVHQARSNWAPSLYRRYYY